MALEKEIENLTEYIKYAFPKEFVQDAFNKFLDAYENIDDPDVVDKINYRDMHEMYQNYMGKFRDERRR
jgi:hypothetical protein